MKRLKVPLNNRNAECLLAHVYISLDVRGSLESVDATPNGCGEAELSVLFGPGEPAEPGGGEAGDTEGALRPAPAPAAPPFMRSRAGPTPGSCSPALTPVLSERCHGRIWCDSSLERVFTSALVCPRWLLLCAELVNAITACGEDDDCARAGSGGALGCGCCMGTLTVCISTPTPP